MQFYCEAAAVAACKVKEINHTSSPQPLPVFFSSTPHSSKATNENLTRHHYKSWHVICDGMATMPSHIFWHGRPWTGSLFDNKSSLFCQNTYGGGHSIISLHAYFG